MIGIGLNIFLRRVISFDADAQIYFDAVLANGGVLSTTEKNAYNVYRINSKTNLYNPDCHIDLPMIGGTVESMVINAQNPGTFDQIAVNTIAADFTANGYTPNGVDSFLRMILIPSVTLTIQSVALEYYSRDNVSEPFVDIGVAVGVSQRILLYLDHTSLNTIFDCYGNTDGRLLGDIVDISGGVTATRVANNDARLFRKGVQYSLGVLSEGTQPNIEFYLGAGNFSGTPQIFSTKQCAGAGIYDGLTPAKVLAQYTARQVLNTTLSRNV